MYSRRDILAVASEELSIMSADEWGVLLDDRLHASDRYTMHDAETSRADEETLAEAEAEMEAGILELVGTAPHQFPPSCSSSPKDSSSNGSSSGGSGGSFVPSLQGFSHNGREDIAALFGLVPAEEAQSERLEWPIVAEDRDFARLDMAAIVANELAPAPLAPLTVTDSLARSDDQCLLIRCTNAELYASPSVECRPHA
jgi:hypothetical protein